MVISEPVVKLRPEKKKHGRVRRGHLVWLVCAGLRPATRDRFFPELGEMADLRLRSNVLGRHHWQWHSAPPILGGRNDAPEEHQSAAVR
jgi:hypothetical protein